jgi:hypothetical protein
MSAARVPRQAPVQPSLRARRQAATPVLSALGNRTVARIAQNDARLLQRYTVMQAVAVTGTQFHAQVKQPNGSFRNGGGVVLQSGPGNTPLRVSEDGQMAVEDTDLGNRQPKVFYATKTVVSSANKALKKHKSEIELYVGQKKAITVTDQGGTQVQLDQILPKRKKVRNKANDKGMGLTVQQVCDAVASKIVGHDVSFDLPQLDKALAMSNTDLNIHEYKVARWFVDRLNHGEATATGNVGGAVANKVARDQIAADYMNVLTNAPMAAALIAQELGVNTFADPRVGQTFGSISLGQDPGGIVDYGQAGQPLRQALIQDATRTSGWRRDIWGTHYGAVIAESAGNKMTLENYGRRGEDPTNVSDDPIYYFQMYGPVTNPGQTWHGQWSAAANPIINPLTMVYG